MKTKHKKLVGGLLIGLVIMSIGAVFATAQTDDTTPIIPFEKRHRLGPLAYNLTEEQQEEIQNLLTTLREENATRDEIQAAIQEKLDEYGVLDNQLDNQITQTEQQLTILYRQKELRNQGYSWDEINSIIQEEFDLENASYMCYSMTFDHGPRREPCGDPNNLTSGEEMDL